jgi:hypothetical protein
MVQEKNPMLDAQVRRIMNEQQGQFAPQAVAQAAPQQGMPINALVALTQAGVLSPRQTFHWIFKQIEPTEFDGIVFKKEVEHQTSDWVDTGEGNNI